MKAPTLLLVNNCMYFLNYLLVIVSQGIFFSLLLLSLNHATHEMHAAALISGGGGGRFRLFRVFLFPFLFFFFFFFFLSFFFSFFPVESAHKMIGETETEAAERIFSGFPLSGSWISHM